MLTMAYCHNKCARWSLLPTTEHTNHQQTQYMAHHRARSSHKTTTEHKKNSSSVSEAAEKNMHYAKGLHMISKGYLIYTKIINLPRYICIVMMQRNIRILL